MGGPRPSPRPTLQGGWARDAVGFKGADRGEGRGERGILIGRVQKGCRGADGAE